LEAECRGLDPTHIPRIGGKTEDETPHRIVGNAAKISAAGALEVGSQEVFSFGCSPCANRLPRIGSGGARNSANGKSFPAVPQIGHSVWRRRPHCEQVGHSAQ
jgi:hypothetical protein